MYLHKFKYSLIDVINSYLMIETKSISLSTWDSRAVAFYWAAKF